MDEIITDIEKSISEFNTSKEHDMLNQSNTSNSFASNSNTNNSAEKPHATLYAEKPYSTQKAFINYLAKGEMNFESKGHLLSRDENNGGYLVPGATMAQIDARMKYLCPLRSLAKVDTIKSESLELLIDKGATDAGWMLTDELTDGGYPDLTKIKIQTHPLYAKPRASQKILDDVGDALEEWIIAKIAQKVAAIENHAFLYGDGDRKPKGILAYPMVPIGDGDWEKIECVDSKAISRNSLLNIVGALKSEYLQNATWLMSRSAFTAIQQITDELGRFLWQPALVSGAPSCLLGYPVVVSDDMPKVEDNSTPILFGDFASTYQIVDRGEISVLRDPYSAKPYVEFYATRRVGGDVVNFDSVKALCIRDG
jgi:HK97 family phage major capsid protein